MSYVDKNKNICFIHIAKNGGRSVSEFLRKNIGAPEAYPRLQEDRGWWFQGQGHATYFRAQDLFPEESKNWFAFTTIRNPVDRAYSAWRAFNTSGMIVRPFNEYLDFIEYFKNASSLWRPGIWTHSQSGGWTGTIGWFFTNNNGNKYLPPHIVPQSFYFDQKNHNINLYTFENLFGFINDSLKLRPNLYQKRQTPVSSIESFPHVHNGKYKKPAHSQEIINQIKRIYPEDFELYEKANML